MGTEDAERMHQEGIRILSNILPQSRQTCGQIRGTVSIERRETRSKFENTNQVRTSTQSLTILSDLTQIIRALYDLRWRHFIRRLISMSPLIKTNV